MRRLFYAGAALVAGAMLTGAAIEASSPSRPVYSLGEPFGNSTDSGYAFTSLCRDPWTGDIVLIGRKTERPARCAVTVAQDFAAMRCGIA